MHWLIKCRSKPDTDALRLIEFPDRSAALAYIHADPYTQAGIFESITVRRWRFGHV